MGLDGGTYVTRSDVLRRQSWQVAQADTSRSTRGGAVSGTPGSAGPSCLRETSAAAWSTCALSGMALQEPLVADYLGALHNKAAVLELLLCRREVWVEGQASLFRHLNRELQAGNAFAHIKSIKDVFAVRLTRPQAVAQAAGSTSSDTAACELRARTSAGAEVAFVCPVTGLPLASTVKAVALVQCGHVVAERALAAVGGCECPACGQRVDPEWDVVAVNGAVAEVERLRYKLQARRKRRKRAANEGPAEGPAKPDKQLRLTDALHSGSAEAGASGGA